MQSTGTLLTELEHLAGELGDCVSLEALADWCGRRGRLIAGLSQRQDLDSMEAVRLQAVLGTGEAARARLLALRENLLAETSMLERQRQWSENCHNVLSAS